MVMRKGNPAFRKVKRNGRTVYVKRKRPAAKKSTSSWFTSKRGTRTKRTVKARSRMQTGKTKKKADAKRKAKFPGRRTSASGNTYWESRKNRSDASRKKRL